MGKDAHDDACCHTCELFGDGDAPATGIEAPVLAVSEPAQLRIFVAQRGGEERMYVPSKTEVTIGRVDSNDIVLSQAVISKRQARFLFKDGAVSVVDMNSACGTFVDGRRITAPTVLREGATIHMGDFVLRVVTE